VPVPVPVGAGTQGSCVGATPLRRWKPTAMPTAGSALSGRESSLQISPRRYHAGHCEIGGTMTLRRPQLCRQAPRQACNRKCAFRGIVHTYASTRMRCCALATAPANAQRRARSAPSLSRAGACSHRGFSVAWVSSARFVVPALSARLCNGSSPPDQKWRQKRRPRTAAPSAPLTVPAA